MAVEAVVLDIDGVLIDTSTSYHRAIRQTLRAVVGETIDTAEIQALKNAGGFNNDWDLTTAAAAYLIARREGLSLSLTGFADAIAERGSGLSTANAVLADRLDPDVTAVVESAVDPGELRRTFQWLYLGPDRYHDLEETPPPSHPPSPAGFIDDETILVTGETLAWLADRYQLGVVTGRPAAEAAIALDRLPVEIRLSHRVTMDDWDAGKPDPAGLVRLAETFDVTDVLFIGDELDDVRTAVNATSVDDRRTYHGVGVLSGGLSGADGRQRFEAVGAAAVLEDVNQLPTYLQS